MYLNAKIRMSATAAQVVNVFSGPPVIGLDNIFAKGPLTASSEAADFQKENVYDQLTYSFWHPTATPATLQVVSAVGGQYLNYLGIAAHTLGSSGCTFKLQYYDGAAWQDMTPVMAPVNDKVIFIPLTQVYTNKVRLNILSGNPPYIGVLHCGAAFVFQRNLYIGHAPIALNRTLEFAQNISELELDLGRSMANKGASTNVKVNNLTPDWVRNNLSPVIDQIITKAFFFCWRPALYPEDSAYCWLTDNYPTFSNSGVNNLMTFEMNIAGMVI